MINNVNLRRNVGHTHQIPDLSKPLEKRISYLLFIEPAKIKYVINTISFSLVKSYMVLRYALDIIFANLIGSGIEP